MSKDREVIKVRATIGPAVSSTNPLISLFYDLLRDHIHPGDLEGLVQQLEKHSGKECHYTNGFIALYANNLVDRITKVGSSHLKQAAWQAWWAAFERLGYDNSPNLDEVKANSQVEFNDWWEKTSREPK